MDHNGVIDVWDIQLTAGHWNQTGTFTSDNNHNHLGQTWTGSNNPLKIQGAFGAPDYTPLLLSNSTGHGLAVTSATIDGIYVGSVGAYGMVVNHADQDGVYVGTAGSPSSSQASTASNGFEVAGAQGSGLYVGRADSYGVYVASAGVTGMTVHNTPTGYLADATASRGFLSMNSGGSGLSVSSSGTFGVYVENAGSDGVQVWSAAGNGVNADGNLYGGYFWAISTSRGTASAAYKPTSPSTPAIAPYSPVTWSASRP